MGQWRGWATPWGVVVGGAVGEGEWPIALGRSYVGLGSGWSVEGNAIDAIGGVQIVNACWEGGRGVNKEERAVNG